MVKNIFLLGGVFFILYYMYNENKLLEYKFEYQQELYNEYFDSLYTVIDSLKYKNGLYTEK